MLDVARLLASDLRVERLSYKLMACAMELTRCERACLYLVDKERQDLAAFALTGARRSSGAETGGDGARGAQSGGAADGEDGDGEEGGELKEARVRIPITHGLAGHTASTGEVLSIADVYAQLGARGMHACVMLCAML